MSFETDEESLREMLNYALTTGRIEQHRGTGRWLVVRFPLHNEDQFDTYRMRVLGRLQQLKEEACQLERDRTNNYRLGLDEAITETID